jgi:hypothetical protein
MADNDDDLVDYDEEEVRLLPRSVIHDRRRRHKSRVQYSTGLDWIGSFQVR